MLIRWRSIEVSKSALPESATQRQRRNSESATCEPLSGHRCVQPFACNCTCICNSPTVPFLGYLFRLQVITARDTEDHEFMI